MGIKIKIPILKQGGFHALALLIPLVIISVISFVGYTVYTQQQNRKNDFAAWVNGPDIITSQTSDCKPHNSYENYRTNRTFVIDPTDPDTMYVSVEWKGVYKSTNGGRTWEQKATGIKADARKDDPTKGCYGNYPVIVIDPNDSQHLVLGVGSEGGYLTKDRPIGGVYQSFDGAETWQLMINDRMNSYVQDIAFDPAHLGTIYYATASHPGSWVGADQKKLFVSKGLIYKTIDNGKHWQELHTGIGDHTVVASLMMNPQNTSMIIAPTYSSAHLASINDATQNKNTSIAQQGVWRTPDGTRWSTLAKLQPGNPAIRRGFYAPTNFSHMYFVTGNPSVEQYCQVTTDSGKTFQRTKYMDVVTYDPNDTTGNHMFGFTSVITGVIRQNLTLYESNDAGIHWSKTGALPPDITDPTALDSKPSNFVWHPSNPRILYMNGAGGRIWKTTDAGQTWTKLLDHTDLPA